MYGMPTSIRDLYLGMSREGSGRSEEISWSVMDRDLNGDLRIRPWNLLVMTGKT